MDIKTILGRTGLSEDQQIIYQTLLANPKLTIAELARTAKLNRPLVYRIVPELIELGLVSEFKQGKRVHFNAQPPSILRNLLTNTLAELEQALPILTQNYEAGRGQQQVSIFEGKENIKHLFSDLIHTLKKGEVFYRYSARKESLDGEKYLPLGYRAMRDAKQLQRFVITNSTTAKHKRPRLERAIKIIPEKFGLFGDNVTIIIYSNKVATIDYSTETATVIDNPKIASFQKKLFKILFELL